MDSRRRADLLLVNNTTAGAAPVSQESIQPVRSTTPHAWDPPPEFSVSRRRVAGATCVALSGELDLATVPVADRELRQAQREARHVLLDLRALTFIDVCALNMILAANMRARQDGGRMVVLHGSSCVSRMFKLTGTDRMLDTTTDPSAASAPAEPNGARPGPSTNGVPERFRWDIFHDDHRVRIAPAGELNGTGEDQRARLVELERDRAAMEVFARVAAHELMEPLIVAETLARLIQEQLRDRADGNTRSDLDSLIRAVSRMRLLVETVLLDARSHAQPLERRPVSLERLVRDSIELLQGEIRARDARVLAEDLPVVQGDGVMLGGVVTNLLLNALRYGPRKDGEVRVEARRERAHWRISVISQGPTISKEDRARIFEPYRRGTHERRVAGAGLGLAICRSFVERHDGVIGVAPVRAGGHRFYFTIPAIERSTGRASVTPPS